jgi:site-specific DNA recombinase
VDLQKGVIMAEVKTIPKTSRTGKRRVCAYVRVSTDSQEQQHSFEFQKQYWDNLLGENPNVIYLGMYSDEGIGGFKTIQRKGFMQVVRLAEEGKIDTVYTKSFTRFSRNMVESLDCIEKLRVNGVNIIFEKENIDSFDTNSRFTLNLLARVAEEDIRSGSKNVSMSVRSRIAEGKILVPKVYGYNSIYNAKTREYELTVNPMEALVVRLIFDLYLGGMGASLIRKKLMADGIPTPKGKEQWNDTSILGILKNSNYTGNITMQKTYTEDFRRRVNKNDNPNAPMVMIENTHQAIVTQNEFDKVQLLCAKRTIARKREKATANPVYAFTGKIYCEGCGSKYIHKTVYYNRVYKYDLWSCQKYIKEHSRHAEISRSIKDSVLRECFMNAFNECLKNKVEIGKVAELKKRHAILRDAEVDINKMKARGLIGLDQYGQEMADIITELNEIEQEIQERMKTREIIEPLRIGEPMDEAVNRY